MPAQVLANEIVKVSCDILYVLIFVFNYLPLYLFVGLDFSFSHSLTDHTPALILFEKNSRLEPQYFRF